MHDEETGNVHNRARIWSPTLGRFLQRDPIGYRAGLNLYGGYHALHGGVDPTGLAPLEGLGYIMPQYLNPPTNMTASMHETATAVAEVTYNLTGSQTATEIVGTVSDFTAGVLSLLDLGAIDRGCQSACETAAKRVAMAGESPFKAYFNEFALQFTPYGVGVGVNEAFHGSSRRVEDYGRHLDGLTERWPRLLNGASVVTAQAAAALKLAELHSPSPATQAKKCDTCPKLTETYVEITIEGKPVNGYGPKTPYNRRLHYGNTPTSADRALGLTDHQPSLVQRYYEGDATLGTLPEFLLDDLERAASAKDRCRLKPPEEDYHSQGGKLRPYSLKMRKKYFGF